MSKKSDIEENKKIPEVFLDSTRPVTSRLLQAYEEGKKEIFEYILKLGVDTRQVLAAAKKKGDKETVDLIQAQNQITPPNSSIQSSQNSGSAESLGKRKRSVDNPKFFIPISR